MSGQALLVQSRNRAACLLLLGLLCLISSYDAAMAKALSRHPLETRALVDPKGVLEELPGFLAIAKASKDNQELALLYLAQSNACRVIADWTCQTLSAQKARIAAEAANLPELEIRAAIAESRGLMPLQEFNRSEVLLGAAVSLLKLHPYPELSADVYLAYSSLSYTLGKHALAQDYAARGLVALGDNPALLIRTRLLRNQSRAMAQLGNISEAQNVLRMALSLTEKIQDPKLSAELFLEDARIARMKNDVPTQLSNGQKILALAAQLKNAQLDGLGHEVLGLAAVNNGDNALAESELLLAQETYRKLKLDRDERQALRALVQNMLGHERPRAFVEPLMARLIELESTLDAYDRTQANDDFNARLKYIQQQFEVEKLRTSAALATQREKNLEIQQRFYLTIAALSILLVLVSCGFYLYQRRFNKQLRTANNRLSLSEKRMRAIANNIPALISHIDKEQRYLFSNSFSGEVFGMDTQTMIGKSIREVRGEQLYQDLKPYVEAALGGESVSFEGKSEVNGRLYFYQTSYVPDRNADNGVQGFFALTFDITDLKLAEAELERLSRMDSMTNLANRRYFEERLSTALMHGNSNNESIALLYLDIDHLKIINDSNGHAVGDAVIATFAERLLRSVEPVDLVARLGGDEFAVLIKNPTPESGENIAKKFRAIMEKPIIVDNIKLAVTASIGVAYCAQKPSAKELLSLADKALYAAKAAGRATYQTVVGQ